MKAHKNTVYSIAYYMKKIVDGLKLDTVGRSITMGDRWTIWKMITDAGWMELYPDNTDDNSLDTALKAACKQNGWTVV